MEKVKILVPTDFSLCARNALNYALELTQDLNAEIILMHSIDYSDKNFTTSRNQENINTELYNTSKEHLDRETDYVKSKNAYISVRNILEGGPAELSISSLIDQEGINYVVMGTEGASGMKGISFGSFTSNVLLISPCPVFTIPKTAKYTKIKNIICATDFNESEIKSALDIIDLAAYFNATLSFYNVHSNEKEQHQLMGSFKEEISRNKKYDSIMYVLHKSSDVIASIENFACQIEPDLLVTLGKERSFLHQLFSKKVTKNLCLHTTIPLLSYPPLSHRKDKKESEEFARKF